MKDWKKLIDGWYETNKGEYALLLGPPATIAELEQISIFSGHTMPEEFVSLYSLYNGVGLERNGEVSWFFVPTRDLPRFAEATRGWFDDSHPALGSRFFPFFDWLTGDAVGYLWDDDGDLLPFLYEFSHEHYEFDPQQPWEDFFVKDQPSIERFLVEYV